jgi:hypothetical protein
VLLVPPAALFVEPVVTRLARLVPRREPTRVRPRRATLDGHHPIGRLRQQFPVVRDVEDGLLRFGEPGLEPPLGRHVQEVVRLVQQQHLVVAAQQQFQREALLLAARQCPH